MEKAKVTSLPKQEKKSQGMDIKDKKMGGFLQIPSFIYL